MNASHPQVLPAKSPAIVRPHRALLLVATALGLGIASDVLFFEKLPGISFPLYIVLLLGALLTLARRTRTLVSRQALLLMVPLLFFSTMVAVRASGFLAFLNIVTSLYLLLLIAQSMFGMRLRAYRLTQYAEPVFRLPLRFVERATATLAEAAVLRQLARRHPAVPQVIRGVAIAVPLLVLFVALFASADLVFRKFVTDLISIDIDDRILAHIFWVVAAGAAALGWLAYVLRKPADVTPSATGERVFAARYRLGAIETAILFISLNVLFLGFIILQLAYLFGGEQNIISQGFTYAQYARKGFFELIAVAAITFCVVLVVRKLLSGQSRQFTLLAGVLIGQVLVIMVSAFQRLSLYESTYGFTSLRLYSHIFIVWLAVALGLLLYQIVRNRAESMLAFGLFVSVMAALAFVNVFSVDVMVARKNIDRYQATGRIDAGYLRHVSDDAVPELVRLLDSRDERVARTVGTQLYDRRMTLRDTARTWQSANVGRHQALQVLEARGQELRPLGSSDGGYIPR